MDKLIDKKLDELLASIGENEKVKKMKKLKKEIKNDKELKKLLDEFHKEENVYSSKYIELKTKIIENEKVKEYKILENELYFTVLEMNKKLNTLIDKKEC